MFSFGQRPSLGRLVLHSILPGGAPVMVGDVISWASVLPQKAEAYRTPIIVSRGFPRMFVHWVQ
eukprot:3266637-Prorocentrum_lima.AAC.1